MRKTRSGIQVSFHSVCLASFSTAMFGPNYELRGSRAGWTAFPQPSQRLPLNSSRTYSYSETLSTPDKVSPPRFCETLAETIRFVYPSRRAQRMDNEHLKHLPPNTSQALVCFRKDAFQPAHT
jgi:hypothetical protein